ncbi:MAG TPA: GTPase ObgE [Bacilli bacterium]|nr:GTPase ObgE [Bacilli bacterium]
MFIDEVKVKLIAGRGGDGIVAFRREKYVPKGGPAGGNGGRGGSIIFVGDEGKTTLLHLRYNKIIKAKNGEPGRGKNMYGKDAEDVYVYVPLGTVVYDDKTGEVLADITNHKQQVVIAQGGRGGRGNTAFATSRVPAPEFCEKGLPGEVKEVRVELKVLADVGLVGFPSVGKSTLISVVSAARPKIAEYHFTTLHPNLGFVQVPDGRSFVMADLPGLIEGAHLGAGLGIQFLRHIERTRVIVHVIDMSGSEGRDPYDDYQKINNELAQYNESLLKRPQIIAANKMDLPSAKENLPKFLEKVGDVPVIPISAYTKENINELLYKIADVLETIPQNAFLMEPNKEEIVEYTFVKKEKDFTITKDDDGVFHVRGPIIEKYFNLTDFSKDANVKLFAQRLRRLGVDDELRKLGVKHGDTVRILDYEFEFFD